MNEYQIVWTSAFAGLGIVLSALLYSLGGREDKYLRRWIASFVIATAANITAVFLSRWSPWFLVIFPATALGYHLGYGSEDFFTRLFKRIIYITYGIFVPAIILSFVFHNFIILPWLVAFEVFAMFLTIRNPIYAAAEEFFLSMIMNIGWMMILFVK